MLAQLARCRALDCVSHTVLVQHLCQRVPHFFRVGVKVEHVPHHIPQPILRKFLGKNILLLSDKRTRINNIGAYS